MMMGDKRYDWIYPVDPDASLGGRDYNLPAGKMLGGGSAITRKKVRFFSTVDLVNALEHLRRTSTIRPCPRRAVIPLVWRRNMPRRLARMPTAGHWCRRRWHQAKYRSWSACACPFPKLDQRRGSSGAGWRSSWLPRLQNQARDRAGRD